MGLLSPKLPLDQIQSKWASTINPFLANPLNNVSVIENVQLLNGETAVPHLLGRPPQGWFLVDIQGSAIIYRSSPFSAINLTLNTDPTIKAIGTTTSGSPTISAFSNIAFAQVGMAITGVGIPSSTTITAVGTTTLTISNNATANGTLVPLILNSGAITTASIGVF